MGETLMTRHQTILQFMDSSDHYASFSRVPDEEGDYPDIVSITMDDWRDMGSPQTITLEIRPGSDIRD